MTIATALQKATVTLTKTKIILPRLETVLLLAHALKKPKELVLTHPEHTLRPAQKRRFFALVKRRAAREPFAYITGHKEFYGLDFLVNYHTLIPRPETEILIDAMREKLLVTSYQLPVTIIDVGTGSGAIAITLAKLLPRATIYATDISAAALRIARKNAKRHHVRVHFKKGNLLEPVEIQMTKSKCQMLIIANLPYLPTTTWRATQPEVKRYEPRTALDGGPDGLRYYRTLILRTKQLLVTSYELPVTLYFEIDPRQTKPLTILILKTFPDARVEIKKDLTGRNRVLIAIV